MVLMGPSVGTVKESHSSNCNGSYPRSNYDLIFEMVS